MLNLAPADSLDMDPLSQPKEMVQRQARRPQDRDCPIREHDPRRRRPAKEGGQAGFGDLAWRQDVVGFGRSIGFASRDGMWS